MQTITKHLINMADRRRPYPSGHLLMLLIYQKKQEIETLSFLKQPSQKISCHPKSAIFNPVHYSKQITKGCISYQKISLPPEAMLQEPYLRGKNQGSTYWDRRHSIPRYWNIWMLDNITTQPYLTKGQEPLELLMVFNPDPSQLSLKYLKETSLSRIYHKTFQKICII